MTVSAAARVMDLDVVQEYLKATSGDDPYAKSPFLPIKMMSSRSKGAIFERIAEALLVEQGFTVERAAGTSDYDRLVNGLRTEIKGSFMWNGTTNFRWQQIRPRQDYDAIIFMSFYPSAVQMHAATKETVIAHLSVRDDNGLWKYAQHGGSKSSGDTLAINGTPSDFPWMQADLTKIFGGPKQ